MTKEENLLRIATGRGFFFPTAEIYKNSAGFWTYGHLGKLMKNNFENLWRNYFLSLNDNYHEIEGNCILPEKVFESSGHIKNFNDPLIECRKCHYRFRADNLIEEQLKKNIDGLSLNELNEIAKKNKLTCPNCKSHDMEEIKPFNMMFNVRIGAIGNEVAYLSPETAQNPYLSFKREFFATREKLPLGLAMIGKAYRNEISPRHGFFRLREFTQAELQIFFNPKNIDKCDEFELIKNEKVKVLLTGDKKEKEISLNELHKKGVPRFYLFNLNKIKEFYLNILKIDREKFRFRELGKDERAFYNKIHFDMEVFFDTLNGFKEIGGLHYRTEHDLLGHANGSKERLDVNIDNEKFIPHVLELSFGVDRNIWMLMDICYKEDRERSYFIFPEKIAPIKSAVFPLVNKDKLPEFAEKVYDEIKNEFKTFFDNKGSIGKMYRRMDEIGCKCMVTIDHDSLKNNDVTIRDVATMKQVRVKVKELKETLNKLFSGKVKFLDAGKIVK